MADEQHMHPAVRKRQAREYAKAVKTAEDAVAKATATHGSAHGRVADALCVLGTIHQSHGAFDTAEPTFLKALAIREKNPADQDGLVATLRATARMYDASGHQDKARTLLQRASRIEQDAFGMAPGDGDRAELESDRHADFVEEMAGEAPKTFWTQILGGLLVPLFLGWRGVAVVVAARMAFHTRGSLTGPLVVVGTTARLFGVVWICAAAFAHFHFFWPYRNRTLCSYGKAVSLVGGAVLLFIALARMLMG